MCATSIPASEREIVEARKQAEQARAAELARQKPTAENAIERLAQRIKALTGRDIQADARDHRKEPEIPKVHRGPQMRR